MGGLFPFYNATAQRSMAAASPAWKKLMQARTRSGTWKAKNYALQKTRNRVPQAWLALDAAMGGHAVAKG